MTYFEYDENHEMYKQERGIGASTKGKHGLLLKQMVLFTINSFHVESSSKSQDRYKPFLIKEKYKSESGKLNFDRYWGNAQHISYYV